MRWDRVGRVAMVCVLAALLYLYLSAGVQLMSKWSQARHDRAVVVALEHEHQLLVGQHLTLGRRQTLEAEARQLGMTRRGEQPFLVGGLPGN